MGCRRTVNGDGDGSKEQRPDDDIRGEQERTTAGNTSLLTIRARRRLN
jgi:hypothetical protein